MFDLRSLLLTLLMLPIGLPGCSGERSARAGRQGAPPPLVDTLVTIFQQLRETAVANRSDNFLGFLDSSETCRLDVLSRSRGFASLRSYLEYQFASWPDPDTLSFNDLIYQPPYARIALSGTGARIGDGRERLRYTFLLYRRAGETWRLAAVSNLEKERFDLYGTELSYLETELPPKLRFPRLF